MSIFDTSFFPGIVRFFHEIGMLKRTPRSGFAFLGTGGESVAEHSHRTAAIGYALARAAGADAPHTALIGLFHDLAEARTGDMNYVAKRYVTVDERRAFSDAVGGTDLSEELLSLYDEFEAGKTPEAQLARDADQLDLILSLKEELDLGNSEAEDWIKSACQRLMTPQGHATAEQIMKAPHTDWWKIGVDANWWNRRR
ncbi:MAG: HD domain-containing protein [Desulfovibrionaceae bacterium]|nr:HD domain-containing protein [Desulfovibrionaceae bacterium]